MNFIKVIAIYEINDEAFFRAVANTCADNAPNFADKLRLALGLFVVLEDEFKDVIKIDFLRFQQIDLEDNIVPIDP